MQILNAIVSTIFSQSGIAIVEALKWLLFVPAFVLSTAGVVIGLHWESEKFIPPKQKRGKKLLLYSLIVEMISGALTIGTDGIITISQRAEIIALERHLAPRVLTEEQGALIVSRISVAQKSIDVGPIAYGFTATSEEGINLAIDLSEHVFDKVGWNWNDWPTVASEVATALPGRRTIGWKIMSGIQVQALNPKLSGIVKALADVLTDIGLENVRSDPKADAVLEGINGPMFIMIMIGTKPNLRLPPQ